MDRWFSRLSAECRLAPSVARALDADGFVVIERAIPMRQLASLEAAYDRVMAEAAAPDKAIGRTTTRVHDLVNRGPEFDDIYIRAPVLAASCHTIRGPFKLSALLGRTLHARTVAQDVHRDCQRDRHGWPMVGFIVMVDEFRSGNGATRFLPGSHHATESVAAVPSAGFVFACGPAGSIVIYNGSVLHGHGANDTDRPRRSIQGAYIRRDASGFDWTSRMRSVTADRLGQLAKCVLAL